MLDGKGGEKGEEKEQDDATSQAKAKARAAAGDHERGLAPAQDPPASSDKSGQPSRDVKGDAAQ
jgi:hypothetical protein